METKQRCGGVFSFFSNSLQRIKKWKRRNSCHEFVRKCVVCRRAENTCSRCRKRKVWDFWVCSLCGWLSLNIRFNCNRCKNIILINCFSAFLRTFHFITLSDLRLELAFAQKTIQCERTVKAMWQFGVIDVAIFTIALVHWYTTSI